MIFRLNFVLLLLISSPWYLSKPEYLHLIIIYLKLSYGLEMVWKMVQTLYGLVFKVFWRASETFHLPQFHLSRSYHFWQIYVFVPMLWQHILHAHCSLSMYLLTVARLYLICCSSSVCSRCSLPRSNTLILSYSFTC